MTKDTRQAQHTPGPWRVDHNRYDNEWRVYQVDGPPIINSLFHSGEESKANARLIAEAPNMLKALRDLVDCPDYKDISTHEMINARATIAAARGRDAD